MTFDEWWLLTKPAEVDDLKEYFIEAYNAGLQDMKQQRDVAFAMSKCECEGNECCRNLVKLHDRIAELEAIEAAARNLIAVKGRHHSELAYKQLGDALEKTT